MKTKTTTNKHVPPVGRVVEGVFGGAVLLIALALRGVSGSLVRGGCGAFRGGVGHGGVGALWGQEKYIATTRKK